MWSNCLFFIFLSLTRVGIRMYVWQTSLYSNFFFLNSCVHINFLHKKYLNGLSLLSLFTKNLKAKFSKMSIIKIS